MDVVDPEQIQLINKSKSVDSQQIVTKTQMAPKQMVVKAVNDFPQVKADKYIRIRHSDNPIEQK